MDFCCYMMITSRRGLRLHCQIVSTFRIRNGEGGFPTFFAHQSGVVCAALNWADFLNPYLCPCCHSNDISSILDIIVDCSHLKAYHDFHAMLSIRTRPSIHPHRHGPRRWYPRELNTVQLSSFNVLLGTYRGYSKSRYTVNLMSMRCLIATSAERSNLSVSKKISSPLLSDTRISESITFYQCCKMRFKVIPEN